MIRKHSHVKIGRYHQVQARVEGWESAGLHGTQSWDPAPLPPASCGLSNRPGWSVELLSRPPRRVPYEMGPWPHPGGPFFPQHLQEQLDLDLSPLEYMMKCYPEIKEKEEMRKIIGRYGLTGKQQVSGGVRVKDPREVRDWLDGQASPSWPPRFGSSPPSLL